MKYLVVLCDGMSDLPCDGLGGKTPMSAANKPTMDALAAVSEIGLAKTVPDSLLPGSDVANLSVLGYNPTEYYTGRSPLEAASIGIDMKPTDVAFRCNLVTLSNEKNFRDCKMLSYCANDISTKKAREIIKLIDGKLGGGRVKFYPGTSYRNCLVWENGTTDIGELTPPHDITGEKIADYLNVNENGAELLALMEKSYALLKGNKGSANCVWLWGGGRKARLPSFKGKYGLNAVMVSAVDLLKGIAITAGMDVIRVENATGYIDTNFKGKAKAAVNALKSPDLGGMGADLAYIHIEAPDECGHRGEVLNKVKSIEMIDKLVLAPILKAFEDGSLGTRRLKILIAPDHPTPLSLKTHTREPVPFMIYDSANPKEKGAAIFSEDSAKNGIYIENGYELMGRFISDGGTGEPYGCAQLAFTESGDVDFEAEINAEIETLERLNRKITEDGEKVVPAGEKPPKRQTPPAGTVRGFFANGGGAVLAVIIAVLALAVSLAKTDLTITRGELFVESGSVNKRLENIISDDLSRKIPRTVKMRNINVTVRLNGGSPDDYTGVSNIGAGDSVDILIVFIPQESVTRFAEDCRVVLDAMREQDLTYNAITFAAEDSFTKIRVELNGRFNMDISANEIAGLTRYFGQVGVEDDIPDLNPSE
jgi:2,3-bisphosphoglycerate-independent phosphoglycerate mutase